MSRSTPARRVGLGRRSLIVALQVFLLHAVAGSVRAQSQNDFAGSSRLAATTIASNAARALQSSIAIRIQQAIASLPPSAPQPVEYRFDAENQTWVRRDALPPTIFTTPDTVSRGTVSVGVSTSYFALRSLERRANYQLNFFVECASDCRSTYSNRGYFKFGVAAAARAGILTLAGSYGLTENVEADLLVPITVVSASASLQYSATRPFDESSNFYDLTTFPSVRRLDRELQPGGSSRLRSRPLGDVGVAGFDGSTEVGLGRVGAIVKYSLPSWEGARFGATLGTFLPSPSEDQLAGTATTSIYPRLLASVPIGAALRGYCDVGYEYDLDEAALRRFAWNIGASYSTPLVALDAAVSGSLYEQSLELFPRHAVLAEPTASTTIVDRLDDSDLATNFVDFVVGIRVPVTERAFVAGAVTIPVVNVEFRPEAIGTISAQIEF